MPNEIIVIEKRENVGESMDLTTEAWGSLTAICNAHPEFQYHTIKIIDYPFFHKGYLFKKLKYNSRADEE